MRFKKLRISVAVALIIFVLVIANTIAFGLSKNKQDSLNLAATIDPKKDSQTTPNQNPSQISTSTDSSQQVTTIDNSQPIATNPQVINHPMMKTRAS